MFIDQIEKLKIYQFSEPFQNWFYTLLFLPLALYFRFVIGTSLISDKDFTAFSRSVWILGLVFGLWLLWKWFFDDLVLLTGLEKHIGLFFLIICISTAFSANRSLSLEKLIDISTYIFGVYLLLDLKRSPKLWQGIINALLITAGLSSLLILISAIPWINLYQLTFAQIIVNPIYLLRAIPRLPYSLGLHQSITAGYLVLIMPLTVYQYIQSEKFLWKAIQLFGIALNILVLLLTQSRGGLLGLFFLILASLIIFRNDIWGLYLNNRKLGLLIISSIVLAGIGFFIFIGRSRGFSLGGRTIQMRFDQWRIAIQYIQSKPWFGLGLGTFAQKYLELRDPAFFPGTFVHSHNQLIQTTFELGFLGLASMLLLGWQWIRLSVKEKGSSPASTKVMLIAMGGFFGVLIPDAVNSAMIILLILFYFVWIFPAEEKLPKVEKSIGLLSMSLIAILLAGSFGWLLWKIQPYDQALRAAGQNDWHKTSTSLITALDRDPSNPYYLHSLAYIEGQIACQEEENINQALDYYQLSFEIFNNWGIDHANAAVLYAISGDYQNAANHMEQAVKNYPQTSTFSCLLGDYYSALSKSEDAIESYVQCIEISPQFLDSPFWQENRHRRDLIPTVITTLEAEIDSQIGGDSNKTMATLYLAANEPETAKRFIQDFLLDYPNDLDGNVIYIKILESMDDLSTAKGLIEKLLKSYPRDSDLWIFKGKLAQQEGYNEEAEHALTLGFRLKPSTESGMNLGQYYLSMGDFETAQEIYSTAFQIIPSSRMNDFSRQVAFRWPFREEYLSCMPMIRTYEDYFSPALNAATDIEDFDCTFTGCIYQKLLNDNSAANEAQFRFDSLSCSEEIDAEYCFKR